MRAPRLALRLRLHAWRLGVLAIDRSLVVFAWLGALVVAAGCGHASPAVVTAPRADVERAADRAVTRRPDAVVVDPPPSLPSAVAHVEARGVVSLREPPGNAAVAELLQAFIDGWERESIDALVALLTPDAGAIDGSEHGHATLVDGWRQRLRAHDYARLAGTDILRPDRIQRWAWDELGAPDAPPRPASMRPAEIYVRAPLEVTRIAGEKVFGDVMVMVLRREDGKLRIAAYGEMDAP